jgi:hypothetical protein
MDKEVQRITQEGLEESSRLFLYFLKGMLTISDTALKGKSKEDLVNLWLMAVFYHSVTIAKGCVLVHLRGTKKLLAVVHIPFWMASFLNGISIPNDEACACGYSAHLLYE